MGTDLLHGWVHWLAPSQVTEIARTRVPTESQQRLMGLKHKKISPIFCFYVIAVNDDWTAPDRDSCCCCCQEYRLENC